MNEVSRKMKVKPLTAVLVRPKRMSDLAGLHRGFNVSGETQAVFPSAVLLNIFSILSLVDEIVAVIQSVRRPRRAALPVRLDVQRRP